MGVDKRAVCQKSLAKAARSMGGAPDAMFVPDLSSGG